MKSILKLFLFMGIILLSKLTKENEVTPASVTTKTERVEGTFTNYQQQTEELSEQEQQEEKVAESIY